MLHGGGYIAPHRTHDFMKRLIAASLALCAPFLFPFTASAASIDDSINEVMGPVTEAITSVIFWTVDIAGFTVPFVLIWLFVGALFFTVYSSSISVHSSMPSRWCRASMTTPTTRGKFPTFRH
jgi:hypothetical protein